MIYEPLPQRKLRFRTRKQPSLETIPESEEETETLCGIEKETGGGTAVDKGGEAAVDTAGPETRACDRQVPLTSRWSFSTWQGPLALYLGSLRCTMVLSW